MQGICAYRKRYIWLFVCVWLHVSHAQQILFAHTIFVSLVYYFFFHFRSPKLSHVSIYACMHVNGVYCVAQVKQKKEKKMQHISAIKMNRAHEKNVATPNFGCESNGIFRKAICDTLIRKWILKWESSGQVTRFLATMVTFGMCVFWHRCDARTDRRRWRKIADF